MLEAHANGLRYTSNKSETIDIIYKNIKHAFYQPPKNELMLLLHFTLKNGILIGKKQYSEIQFFTEVGELVTDLDQARNRHERDEIEAEQRERQMRAELSKKFQGFFKKVEEETNNEVEFEIPISDLSFEGEAGKGGEGGQRCGESQGGRGRGERERIKRKGAFSHHTQSSPLLNFV